MELTTILTLATVTLAIAVVCLVARLRRVESELHHLKLAAFRPTEPKPEPVETHWARAF